MGTRRTIQPCPTRTHGWTRHSRCTHLLSWIKKNIALHQPRAAKTSQRRGRGRERRGCHGRTGRDTPTPTPTANGRPRRDTPTPTANGRTRRCRTQPARRLPRPDTAAEHGAPLVACGRATAVGVGVAARHRGGSTGRFPRPHAAPGARAPLVACRGPAAVGVHAAARGRRWRARRLPWLHAPPQG